MWVCGVIIARERERRETITLLPGTIKDGMSGDIRFLNQTKKWRC